MTNQQDKRPEEDLKNDRRRRTSRSELNSVNERRTHISPDKGPEREHN